MAGKFVPMTIAVGDYVIFGKYQSGGEPIEVDGKTYILARAGDLGGKSRDGNPLRMNRYDLDLLQPRDLMGTSYNLPLK